MYLTYVFILIVDSPQGVGTLSTDGNSAGQRMRQARQKYAITLLAVME